jgi:DNA-binding CsgD family transcriptional regulator/PAS domain-containing protein
MVRGEAVLAALERIYEAPLVEHGWARALTAIAAAVHSPHGVFLVQNAVSGVADYTCGCGMTEEQSQGFAAAASRGHLPRWMQTAMQGVALQGSAMVSNSEFRRTAYYNEAVRPIGAFHGLVVAPMRTQERVVYLQVGRSLGKDDYNPHDVKVIQKLTPQILTALRIGERLAAAELRAAGAFAAFDNIGAGVILVDRTSKVLYANRMAETLLERQHGLAVDADGLTAADPQGRRTLRRLVGSCAEFSLEAGPGGAVELKQGEGHASLRVIVAPFRPDDIGLNMGWLGMARPSAILIIYDTEQESAVRKERLRNRFGLTPAEVRIFELIVVGKTPAEISGQLGLSLATVRTHLSRVFEKTGCARQADLVAMASKVTLTV